MARRSGRRRAAGTRPGGRGRPRSFAELVKMAREHTGLTQAELAALIGCERRVLSRWETGERQGRAPTIALFKILYVLPSEAVAALRRETLDI